jgi:4'-phosphopantetheinyl transferase
MRVDEIKPNADLRVLLLDLNQLSQTGREREKEGIKILLQKEFPEQHISLKYDEHGKPYLENCSEFISISHSRNLLALALSSNNVGIDIEMISDKAEKVKHKFLKFHELNETIDAQLIVFTIYWCAKEVLYKLNGKKGFVLKNDFTVLPFIYDRNGGEIKGMIHQSELNKEIRMRYIIKNNFVIVYSL